MGMHNAFDRPTISHSSVMLVLVLEDWVLVSVSCT